MQQAEAIVLEMVSNLAIGIVCEENWLIVLLENLISSSQNPELILIIMCRGVAKVSGVLMGAQYSVCIWNLVHKDFKKLIQINYNTNYNKFDLDLNILSILILQIND